MASERSSHIPDETYEELIKATITALYKTGYAGLGVRDIDAEFAKSRQLINHYFDGKDDLITEILVYLLQDDNGVTHTGAGTANQDYYCFGEPIYAPVDGVVVDCRNDHRDGPNPGGSLDVYQCDICGNYVVSTTATSTACSPTSSKGA